MRAITTILALLLATQASADPPPQPAPAPQTASLAGMAFLAGDWNIAGGRVPLYGAHPEGFEKITPELDGKAYVMEVHTVLFGVEGQDMGTNDSVLLVYPDGDAIKAEYTNGHVGTAYKVEIVEPGKLVRFTSDKPGVFYQFTFALKDPDTIEVARAVKKAEEEAFAPFEFETLKRRK
jgi:hypothetical protein